MDDTASWKPEDVVILVPILHRPHLIQPLMGNLRATTPEGVGLLFLPNLDDTESNAELDRVGAQSLARDRKIGWAEKINHAVEAFFRYRWYFCCADDVLLHDDWLDEVMDVMTTYPNTRVVGTLDMLTENVMSGDHATHFMVDRRYIDEIGGVADEGPGSFLCEKYRHNYVDTEFVETAKSRGVFQPSRAIVEHLHPLGGLVQYDETYRIGDESKDADARIFEKRRALWEGA